ncbi:MAG: flagellar basal body rod protein FlgB [Deltaproteobacteria bacterium]|nr:flagellar basal body rod protein FlgB [Deltaproteobacteria bacterium]NCP96570.1 flagellar basal body rod protein FlgB [Deltaproteobacteria bacterium]NCS74231.1 flagellar basal body rod protein FlgB [Deltaproteobacteria bacterium]OIP62049.1 MAG: flagellar basal-body rod protein FlgB [Nitrospirae bacterium CG2_30_70_394]
MDIAHLLLPQLPTYQRALTLRSARQELLSRNLANGATPGYRALDLPFEQAMRTATTASAPPLATTDAHHLAPPVATLAPVELVETGGKAGLDQNTVDMEQEAGRMAENSLMYDATAQLTATYFAHLLHAIREGR